MKILKGGESVHRMKPDYDIDAVRWFYGEDKHLRTASLART